MSGLEARVDTDRRLGFLPAAFLGAHTIHFIRAHELEHLWWSCNVANALLAIGLFAKNKTLIAVSFLWLAVGFACWLIDLWCTGDFVPTQLLTHMGALAVAAFATRKAGVPRGTWWKAMLGHIALQQLTRLFTPPAENINLAFDVFEASKPWFPSYAVYYVIVSAGFSASFFALERAVGPREAE